MKLQSMDGCTAATYIAYAFSEVATIYPITPIAGMGETADKWSVAGVKNLFGSPMQVKEMESELGAAGAIHGALCGGALATTFTSSQGLMLMIPNLYKVAGELLPGVWHVGCRSLATHALSIFGDHQDVMACRATGVTMLASDSVQATHDLAIVAHMAALEGSLPVIHFFDGWRTSNETCTISTADYTELLPLLPVDDVKRFRSRSMNPEHADLRGSAQNWDVYFQNTEARNKYYDAFPSIVQQAMDKVAALTGRSYHLFDYYGAPDAEDVIVTIGSSGIVAEEAIDALNASGSKYGVVKVRLYRPFSAEHLLAALPKSTKRIAVLDRTKEPGSLGEPLYLDVCTAVQNAALDIKVIGGRYGLGSKDFNPTMVKAVFDNLRSEYPVKGFTVGIDDDVTHTSLSLASPLVLSHPAVTAAIFYGMGSDGTVGATRMAAHILEETAKLYSQAYFEYSAKKSGGFTISQLRFSKSPVRQSYAIDTANYVACNKSMYVNRYDLVDKISPGGIFVLNSPWSAQEMLTKLPDALRRAIVDKKLKFYNIDALSIAEKHNLGVRINMIMLATFFYLSKTIPYDEAMEAMKRHITDLYQHEGMQMVNDNIAAIESVASSIVEIDTSSLQSGSYETSSEAALPSGTAPALASFVLTVARPCNRLEGDRLPVSAFSPDGIMPMGTTAFEKRTIADLIPHWDVDKCIECTQCSFVCAHAAIRPYLLDEKEKECAPTQFDTKPARAKALSGLQYRIQVYPQDCTGCGSCATICPGHALTMTPIAQELDLQKEMLDYAENHISIKDTLMPRASLPGSQFCKPLLQFSGACAGCGETPYVKLLTQLMGERMVIANATGCSSIWGANYPSNAYCVNQHGLGPAWGNSLFEDNAEYGYGIAVAIAHRREYLASLAQTAVADESTSESVKSALQAWLDARADAIRSAETGRAAVEALKGAPSTAGCSEMLEMADLYAKKSVWAIGGDGWAYDIGFAGLDHVLAQNIDINILVMDTECYSNTGGQTSKATPMSAVTKYSTDGKRTFKKDLGKMMMAYPEVYVAQIAMGANYMQSIKALMEADAHPGPSIVIAYCPCINHGIRTGMSHSIVEEKLAVEAGYWQLYRRNPAVAPSLVIDSVKPTGDVMTFINGEDRYADLKQRDPEEASVLQSELAKELPQRALNASEAPDSQNG